MVSAYNAVANGLLEKQNDGADYHQTEEREEKEPSVSSKHSSVKQSKSGSNSPQLSNKSASSKKSESGTGKGSDAKSTHDDIPDND